MAFDNKKWQEVIQQLESATDKQQKYILLDNLVSTLEELGAEDKVENWEKDKKRIESVVSNITNENDLEGVRWKEAAENKFRWLTATVEDVVQGKVVASPAQKEESVAVASSARKEGPMIVESAALKEEPVGVASPLPEIDVAQFIRIPRDYAKYAKEDTSAINSTGQLMQELHSFARVQEDAPFTLSKLTKAGTREVVYKPGLFKHTDTYQVQSDNFMAILYRCDFSQIKWEDVFMPFEAEDGIKEQYNFLQVFLAAGIQRIPPLQQQWFFAKLIEEIGQKRFRELYTQDFVAVAKHAEEQPPIKNLGSLQVILASHKQADGKTRSAKKDETKAVVTAENRNAVTTVSLLEPMFNMVLVVNSANKEEIAKTEQDLLVAQVVAEILSFRVSGGAFNSKSNYFLFKALGILEPNTQVQQAGAENTEAVEKRFKDEFVNKFGLDRELLEQAWAPALSILTVAKQGAEKKAAQGLSADVEIILDDANDKAFYAFFTTYVSQYIAKRYFNETDTAKKTRLALLLTDKSFSGIGVLNYLLSSFSPLNDDKGPDFFVKDIILALLRLDTSIAVSPIEILDINTMASSAYPYNNALTALGHVEGTRELFSHFDEQVKVKEEALAKLQHILNSIKTSNPSLASTLTTNDVAKLVPQDLGILAEAKLLEQDELKTMQEVIDDKAFLQKELGGGTPIELNKGAKLFIEGARAKSREEESLVETYAKLAVIKLELAPQTSDLVFLSANLPKIRAFFKQIQTLTQENISQSFEAAKAIQSTTKMKVLREFLACHMKTMMQQATIFYQLDRTMYTSEAEHYFAVYFKEISGIVSVIRNIESWLNRYEVTSELSTCIDALILPFEKVPYIPSTQSDSSSQAVDEYLARMCLILETFYSPRVPSKTLGGALSAQLAAVMEGIEQQKKAGDAQFIKNYNATQGAISAKLAMIVSYLPEDEKTKLQAYQNGFAAQISEPVRALATFSGSSSSPATAASSSSSASPNEALTYHVNRAHAIIEACHSAAQNCLNHISNPTGRAKLAYTFIPDKMMTRESKHARGKQRAEGIGTIYSALASIKAESSERSTNYAVETHVLKQLGQLIEIISASVDKKSGGGYTSDASLNFHLAALLNEKAFLFNEKFNNINDVSSVGGTQVNSEGKEKDVAKLLANAEATFKLLKQDLLNNGVNVDNIPGLKAR